MALLHYISQLKPLIEAKKPDINTTAITLRHNFYTHINTTAITLRHNFYTAIYDQFLTKPSMQRTMWYSSRDIAKETLIHGLMYGGLGAYSFEVLVAYKLANKGRSRLVTSLKTAARVGHLTKSLATFAAINNFISSVSKNYVYIRCGGEKLVMDDIIISALSGGVAGLFVFPLRSIPRRCISYAAIEAFFSKLYLISKEDGVKLSKNC